MKGVEFTLEFGSKVTVSHPHIMCVREVSHRKEIVEVHLADGNYFNVQGTYEKIRDVIYGKDPYRGV